MSELEFSEGIEFLDGAVKFTYRGQAYEVKKPSALKALGYNKKMDALDKQDYEAAILFYHQVLMENGLSKEVAEELDAYVLGEVFRAILSPPPKKK